MGGATDDEAAELEAEEEELEPVDPWAEYYREQEDEELLPEPQRGGSLARGRQGVRAGAPGSSPSDRSSSSAKAKASASGHDKDKAQRRPRGNLPPAPTFDGDRRRDPKCFRKYASKVDSYVEIAKNIIDDAEIGLRLHAALDGEASDYLEDIPARTFGVEQGWQVLLKLLKDKFDEKRMHKVGSAMKGFFKLGQTLNDKSYTLVEVIDLMDKAARRCKEADLTIPDEVMVYFLFEHTAMSTERQANLLLRTGGEYHWKKIKQAVELLYQGVVVRGNREGREPPVRRQRAAHEAQQWDYGDLRTPSAAATDEQIQTWIADYDPIEALADADVDELPEEVARELHECFSTHRENRQRLSRAVQARGFYVNAGGKGKGKGSKGDVGKSKGKGGGKGKKGGGKARGMSLEELKAKTACGDCGLKGHWRGDPECKMKNAHQAGRADPEDVDGDDWYGEYNDEQWHSWEENRYGYAATRLAHPTSSSTPAAPSSATSSALTSSDFVHAEAGYVARGVNKVIQKATGAKAGVDPVTASEVKTKLQPGRREAEGANCSGQPARDGTKYDIGQCAGGFRPLRFEATRAQGQVCASGSAR